MMASKKSDVGIQRPKKAPVKKIGTAQLVLVAVVTVIIIVLAVLLFAGGGKKPATSRRSVAARDTVLGAETSRPRKSAARVAAASRAKRDSAKARRRLEARARRRQEELAGGGRTTRSASGGYSQRGSTRTASSPTELRAILTDPTGSRSALVGERRLKAGDDVEGRRIVEVGTDAVKVQYRDNTYSVRVGQKIY